MRIWFNHWFSAAYFIISELKGMYIIGSNANEEFTYKPLCAHTEVEPELEGEEYVDFCLDFCTRNKVEVFVPKRGLADISRNLAKFAKIGVRVLADDYEKVSIFADKVRTYDFFRNKGLGCLPMFNCVTSAAEFEAIYKYLKFLPLCVKFALDEGAQSFRIIDNAPRTLTRSRYRLQYGELLELLGDTFPKLLVMQYLSGDEISADCLATSRGNIIIPRKKMYGRVEKIFFDETVVDLCGKILDISGLQCPCNIQFRYDKGKLYLLEINTRMSGGLHLAAACVNIPLVAINKLIGNDVSWSLTKTEQLVTFAEMPILLR
ncbi:hypothetical protein AGMMS49975_07360 [Clostridia bacterium]|nr:hypothetical protein AGMMS49975_07360 [Clostridia bacterium]